MTELKSTLAIWGAWRARLAPETQSETGYAGMLSRVLEQGLDWIDHADIYDDGAVESLHGAAADRLPAEARARLRVISKCGVRFPSAGQPGVRVCHYRSDADFIRQQAEASLARLKVEQIDLYLLHRPDYLMQAEETARALEELRAAGKIAAYGASNFSPSQFANLRSRARDLSAHQIEFSALENTALDSGTIDQAREAGSVVLAWSPLGGGRLFDDADPVMQRLGPVLDRIAAEIGTDRAGIALKWVARTGAVPILGTMKADRLNSQIASLRGPGMDVQHWYEILEAARGQRAP